MVLCMVPHVSAEKRFTSGLNCLKEGEVLRCLITMDGRPTEVTEANRLS